MRLYSKRERFLCALVALLVFLPVGILVAYLGIVDREARTWSLYLGLVGLWGGVFLFAKIAISGRSTAFFEKPVDVAPARLTTSNMHKPAKSNVVSDVLNAGGANFIAFIVGYPVAIFGPSFLEMTLPFGMFWGYVLLVGFYAFSQFRKGRIRRAILAGSLAAIVLIALAMTLRIA